jgi:drug/metabolite transporter (DMT)-like permease
MLSAGFLFSVLSFSSGETKTFEVAAVTTTGWLSLAYLVVFGSLIGYSSYVWLLSVRPATQVSTHSYVNPIVAVLLGVLIVGESLTVLQVAGLVIILLSVLLVNLNKYRKPKAVTVERPAKLACEVS